VPESLPPCPGSITIVLIEFEFICALLYKLNTKIIAMNNIDLTLDKKI
jgi:hypothetical protein